MQSLFEKFALGFYGCDGGDLGSPSGRSIWTCGIEWGGGEDLDTLEEDFRDAIQAEKAAEPPPGYEDWSLNLKYHYNRQLMKMLSVISGSSAGDSKTLYSEAKKFAEDVRPFIQGYRGFFKMNLYPLAFRDTSRAHWTREFSQATGFDTKDEYMEWIRENRFPVIRSWAEKHVPKLVLCTGISYKSEFFQAFGVDDAGKSEVIDGRELAYGFNRQGTLVAVVPFMLNHNGLVKNASIIQFGEKIRKLMPDANS